MQLGIRPFPRILTALLTCFNTRICHYVSRHNSANKLHLPAATPAQMQMQRWNIVRATRMNSLYCQHATIPSTRELSARFKCPGVLKGLLLCLTFQTH